MTNNHKVSAIYENERLDVFVSLVENCSRNHAQKLIDSGNVLVNNQEKKVKYKVKIADDVCVITAEAVPCGVSACDIPIEIVFQDDCLAVVNKPQGMTVHQGAGTNNDTLVNALLFKLDKLSGINGEIRPGIVHRIDKNTSGLLVVAKTDKAHLSLAKQIEQKTCKRTYVALVEGNIKEDSGRIETFINRSSKDRTKMAVAKFGRVAITNYRVLKRYKKYTYCCFMLETGRTHQIRVHAKHMGNPVVGDKEYGVKNGKFNLEGQLLHAVKLEFDHPITNERMVFNAPIPDYFRNILKNI